MRGNKVGHQNQNNRKRKPPSLRQIRRACNQELYRTLKRLKRYVPPEKVRQAEALYLNKVVSRLTWVFENGNNRSLLCDWWEEAVCDDIAKLWEVESKVLAKAFREAFGG